jgi:hypothetical protein
MQCDFCIGNYDAVTSEKALCRRENKILWRAQLRRTFATP